MSKIIHYSGINLQNIRYLCARRNITLTDLAEKIGINYVGLSKIIRENTTTLSTLQRISEALRVPVQAFFLSEDELRSVEDFSIERFRELLAENTRLRAEVSDLKDRIIRLAEKF